MLYRRDALRVAVVGSGQRAGAGSIKVRDDLSTVVLPLSLLRPLILYRIIQRSK
jgi:hypothetical protein